MHTSIESFPISMYNPDADVNSGAALIEGGGTQGYIMYCNAEQVSHATGSNAASHASSYQQQPGNASAPSTNGPLCTAQNGVAAPEPSLNSVPGGTEVQSIDPASG